jgi:hypothetical protein
MPWTALPRRGTGRAGQVSGSRGRIEAVGEGLEVARVLVEAGGAAGERDGLAVVTGSLGLVATSLVDVAEALEAVDVIGEATHEVAGGSLGLVEAPGVDEIDDGVGQMVEIVIVERRTRGRGRTHRLTRGRGLLLGQAAELVLLAAAAGAGGISRGHGHEDPDLRGR